jgi:hypothetical protein
MHRALVRRVLYMCGVVALAAGPLGATPVAAGQAGVASSMFCGTKVSAALAGYANSGGAGARTDVDREPASNEVAGEVPDASKGKGGSRFRATVDVYVHVVSDGTTGNVSDAAIADQMTVLNNGFSGREGGTDTGFRFRLAGVDRTDNAAWYNAGPNTPDERDMKRALRQGDASDLNIYITTAEVYLGWAYFPSTYKTRPYVDGIVIDWESLPGTSIRYAGAYDLGKTATHETGHWLGLYHTFQGGCNAKGDYVDDTPPQRTPTRGCPEGKDTCLEPGLDPIHNYMDYSYDSCYDQFTPGQRSRMQDQWLFYRANGGAS